MPTEKRKHRAYKATDKDYNRAMKRAKKNKVKLATLIEYVIIGYGEGFEYLHLSIDPKQ